MLKTGGGEVKETARFVDKFNKFFDCLNVSNYTAGIKSRSTFKDPYRKGAKEDKRLQVVSCNDQLAINT